MSENNPVATESDEFNHGPITVGQIGLSFYRVTGAIVRLVLESLGHSIRIEEGTHDKIFPQLAVGEVDLLVTAWLPDAHSEYWEKHHDDAIRLTSLYENAKLYWAVPEYVPESRVASVTDLTDPEIAQRMRADVVGVGPGSGLETGSKAIIDSYGLADADYRYQTDTEQEWANALREAVPAEKWIVHPSWQPQYLNYNYDVRPLSEPKKLLGETNTAVLVAHNGFPDVVPAETVETLSQISLGLRTVTKLDYEVNIEDETPTTAASAWIESHPETVQQWLMGDERSN